MNKFIVRVALIIAISVMTISKGGAADADAEVSLTEIKQSKIDIENSEMKNAIARKTTAQHLTVKVGGSAILLPNRYIVSVNDSTEESIIFRSSALNAKFGDLFGYVEIFKKRDFFDRELLKYNILDQSDLGGFIILTIQPKKKIIAGHRSLAIIGNELFLFMRDDNTNLASSIIFAYEAFDLAK